MKKLSLVFALTSLVFCVACGSGINGVIGTGNFNNGSLSGNYVYQISGTDQTNGSPYSETGVFAANGSGTITAGVDDLAEVSGSSFDSATTGSYSISKDGTGTVTINNTGFGTITWNVTLVSTSKAYLIEADALNSTGVIEKQVSTALPSAAAAFVFKQHYVSGLNATNSVSTVGQFTLATSGAVTGSEDVNRNGIINNGAGTTNPLTLTGASSFSAADSTGRGTATIADSTGTTDFIYYVVDSNNLRFIATDSTVVGLARAEAQGAIAADPLSGNSYAFGSRADDSVGIGAVDTVGSLTASSGTFTGTLDSTVDATNAYPNVAISAGTYTPVAANGRTLVAYTTAIPSTVSQVFWMVSSTRAFFLTINDSSDTLKVEDGTADQQSGTFSTSSLNGQYAFSMDGVDTVAGAYIDRVGWIQWTGSGNLTWNEAVNSSGTISAPGPLSGTYTVSANGRTTATVNNLSYPNNDIVFYLVSGTNAYILENDPGVQINGAMNKQIQP